jgi:hypothetical protein
LFEGIKKGWAEARASMASKEVEDILTRYNRMDPNSRYFVSSGFSSVLSALEDQHGPLDGLGIEQKKRFAKELITECRRAFQVGGDGIHAQTTRLGAHGGALLALHLELQTLPGNRAKTAVETINRWRTSFQ